MQSPLISDGSGSFSYPKQRPGMTRDRAGSWSASTSLATPPSVDPEPAYIAAAAASQIVSSAHLNHTEDWFEERGETYDQDPAIVSPASIALVNAFLDQILFNFLTSAQSTSIAALRPAVSEVLKPRLAKDAIDGADEELHEFLGGGDEEELDAFHHGLESRGAWDLNLVWRRTRLRCMVYTRLGDMEEEDEETYVAREHLEDSNDGSRRLSRDLGVVSPAAAIFLTSILEFIGEQALVVAGEAAYTRAEAKQMKTAAEGSRDGNVRRLIVEDMDMEKIACNTTLGRLWRSWKKRVRTPSVLGARTISRDFTRGNGMSSPAGDSRSRHASIGEVGESTSRFSVVKVMQRDPETRSPLSNASNYKTTDTTQSQSVFQDSPREDRVAVDRGQQRPSSMTFYPQREESVLPETPASAMQRRRSSSLPATQPTAHGSPLPDVFTTPKEAPESFNNTFQPVLQQSKSGSVVPISNIPSISATTATMYDGVLQPKSGLAANSSSEASQGTAGISKEEFDRQMLELVQEMKPRATPDLIDIERQLSSDSLSTDSADARFKDEANGAVAENADSSGQERREMPASHGVDRRTIQYRRGTKDVSETVQPQYWTEKHSKVRGDQPMQGEKPRRADGSTTDNEYGKTWERQIPYFHYGPPATLKGHEANAVSRDGRILPAEGSVSQTILGVVRPKEADIGAPPLTPLRELMEAAHDTSDEASSIAPSQEGSRSDSAPSDRFQNVELPRSWAPSQARPASKLSDLRSQLPTVNTGTERAAVQRVLPSPVSGRESLTPVGRTSTSSNRDLRPVQTASSSTSQVSQKLKGLVGRDSNDARRPGTSRRSSEGSSSMTSDKRSLRTPKADEAQRSFDQLIKSDETIQYTLTPQNMREMDVHDSPRRNHKRTITGETADFLRKTGPEESETTRSVSNRSKISLKGLNGLRSNPASDNKPPELARPAQTESQAAPSQGTAPSRPTTSHSQAGVARDARTKDESVKEFADFLRSTGPAPGAISPQKPGPPIAEPRPIKALPPTSPRPPSQQGVPKKITQSNPNPVNQDVAQPVQQVEPATTRRPPPKLQARDAATSHNSTSDLAEFIRQGPTDRSEGRMRLPRTGDPLRPFADTNGIQKIANGKPVEAENSRISVASTPVSSAPSKSVHSVNSRTGLLDSSHASPDSRKRSTERALARQDEPPYPGRNQRRVRDPYAIDTDSEDGNGDQSPPQRQEESLIEFLNRVTPPSSPPVSQTTFKKPSPRAGQDLGQEKNHYQSMRERLTRNGVSNGNTKARTSSAQQPVIGIPSVTRGQTEARPPLSNNSRGKAPMPQSSSKSRGRAEAPRSESGNGVRSQAPQLPPLNPRETSPHLISQVGSKLDSYRITSPTYAAHVDRDRKVGRPQQQARAEREPASGLGDLAEFLKNSGPPTDVPPPRPVSPIKEKEKEKEGGFGRMFSRRKKSIH